MCMSTYNAKGPDPELKEDEALSNVELGIHSYAPTVWPNRWPTTNFSQKR